MVDKKEPDLDNVVSTTPDVEPQDQAPATEDTHEIPDDVIPETGVAETTKLGGDLPEPVKVEGNVVERIIEKKRSGFFPAFSGGIIAAMIGFVAGNGDMLDGILPSALQQPDPTVDIRKNTGDIADLQLRIADVATKQDAIEHVDLTPIEAQIAAAHNAIAPVAASVDALRGDLDTISSSLTHLGTQLEALEKRPITESVSKEAIAAYETELARLRDMVAAQRAEYEKMLSDARAMEANAVKAAQIAAARMAMAQLRSALDGGVPFNTALDMIGTAGFDIPAALTESATSGVITLPALRASFPDVARSALAAARTAESGSVDSIGGFLQRHLGARSVTPREGDDPDAILSRAESALTSGNLSNALAELSGLPETALTELQDWISRAEARADAALAANALAAQLDITQLDIN
ncbi:MAG: hypothetical protein GDA36_04165 [Rhodobacteraceae bacterium]|nr:hypothetical protein [Paracoccaceae bacterium]